MSKQSVRHGWVQEIERIQGMHARTRARRARLALDALREGVDAMQEVQAEAFRELREVYGWTLQRLADEHGLKSRQGAQFLAEQVKSKKPEELFSEANADTGG